MWGLKSLYLKDFQAHSITYYTIFTPFHIQLHLFSNFSISKNSVSSVTWQYKSIVICNVPCPKSFCNVLGFMPHSIALVAKVCRSVCNVKGEKSIPALFMFWITNCIHWLIKNCCVGWLFFVTKTRFWNSSFAVLPFRIISDWWTSCRRIWQSPQPEKSYCHRKRRQKSVKRRKRQNDCKG